MSEFAVCAVCNKPVREGLVTCGGMSECWWKFITHTRSVTVDTIEPRLQALEAGLVRLEETVKTLREYVYELRHLHARC